MKIVAESIEYIMHVVEGASSVLICSAIHTHPTNCLPTIATPRKKLAVKAIFKEVEAKMIVPDII